MKSFNNDAELLKFAKKFLDEKIFSLEKDVNHCLVLPYAPFPAIMYCFSIIDLLASLYCGHARPSNTSKNAATYMKDMMHYTEDQCHLLQQVFRHKIVHLAGPRTAYNYKGKIITWHYRHDSPEKHLSIESTPSGGYVQPTSKIKQNITHVFWISIKLLLEDIIQSYKGPNGYYSTLQADPILRKKFDEAVFDMFSPNT